MNLSFSKNNEQIFNETYDKLIIGAVFTNCTFNITLKFDRCVFNNCKFNVKCNILNSITKNCEFNFEE